MKISTLIETLETIQDEHGAIWVEDRSGRLLDATEITRRVSKVVTSPGKTVMILQLDLPTPSEETHD